MLNKALYMALLALSTSTISLAYATNLPQISLTTIGNSEIDLAWQEKDRMFRTWVEFSNFNPNDKSFVMQIIQSETGKIIENSKIQVMTNSQNLLIDFNSFVIYLINDVDICENEDFDSETMSWDECRPMTGKYEMRVLTNDGSVQASTSFTVIDTRE